MTRDELLTNLEQAAAQERANAHKALGKAEAFEASLDALKNLSPDTVVEEDDTDGGK